MEEGTIMPLPGWNYMIRCRSNAKGAEIMYDFARYVQEAKIPSISPYLLRPVRSYEQALADIEAANIRDNNVTLFVRRPSAERRASTNTVAA